MTLTGLIQPVAPQGPMSDATQGWPMQFNVSGGPKDALKPALHAHRCRDDSLESRTGQRSLGKDDHALCRNADASAQRQTG